jgi:hypothetical protein
MIVELAKVKEKVEEEVLPGSVPRKIEEPFVYFE